MTKTLTLVWYFYRPIFMVNLFFSGLAVWSISLDGFSTGSYMIKLLGILLALYFSLKPKPNFFS